MESVSAVKMRKSQERAFAGRPYVHAALRILAQLGASDAGARSPFTLRRPNGKHLLVIVTSDKGLAESVNSAVLKKVELALKEGPADAVCIGRKAVEFARRQNLIVLKEFTNVRDDVALEDVWARRTTAGRLRCATNPALPP